MTRAKRNKIIYWIATVWLSLGLVPTGIVQLLKVPEEVNMFTRLGYPSYLLTMLGFWKLLGTVVVLIPRFPLIKEWAYAGFFFAMTGALLSHLFNGDERKELFGPGLLLILTVVSWYFRPSERTLVPVHEYNKV